MLANLETQQWPQDWKRSVYIPIPKKDKGKECTIKERNGMDLTEAEDIKKRWQEYTEELYKKKKRS